jgi:transposase
MPIFNVSYSPEYNAIEACFSQVKRNFCRERLNTLANFKEFDQNKTIRSSFLKVTPALVKSCAAKSLKMLYDFKEVN